MFYAKQHQFVARLCLDIRHIILLVGAQSCTWELAGCRVSYRANLDDFLQHVCPRYHRFPVAIFNS